ncbi:MAG: L-rhamnose mutarotase [Phycisphaerae bacterium]|nr:L-rhamnose mutarotase [Phycisphaerae bacterium]
MKSFAQTLDLKSDLEIINEYRRHHQAVWPEVVSALRAIGIHRMQIWQLGTRLFMWFEAPDDFDPSRDFQTYANDPRCRQWDAWMRTFQTRVAEAGQHDWWTPMNEVFDLEQCPE